MKDLQSAKIGDLVAEDYRKATVFKKFGLDFCCGGGHTITEACRRHGLDEQEVIDALIALERQGGESASEEQTWSLTRLADHIEETHHHYVRERIPVISEFSQKVARVHGNANPETIEIARLFDELARELSMHMRKEELLLFPYIRNLEAGTGFESPAFGTVANPIRMMEHEHDVAGNLCKDISRLSGGYEPPAHACNTYRVLYAMLDEFEQDLHRHVHLENNVLFPKALKLEQSRSSL